MVPTESFFAFLRRRRYPFTESEAKAPAWGRPLLNMLGAMKALSATQAEVLNLIDQEKLRWVFDLNPNCEPDMLRFLPAEIDCVARGEACPLEWQDAVSVILPSGENHLRGRDICRALAISENQLTAFIERDELTASSAVPFQATVSAESFRRFLEHRSYSTASTR